MPAIYANHSRLATLQPPIDWDDAVGEMLLSMPDDTRADDASARTSTTEADLDLDDLDRFKRSLGSAPPAKFNSEGGLCEPWADDMDWNHDRGLDTIDIDGRLREVGLDAAGYPEPAWRDSSTRESSRIETDSEATVRRRRREALTAALVVLTYAVAAFWWSNTDLQHQIESLSPQNQPSLDEQAQSALTVLSPGVLQGSHNLTVEELAVLKGLIFVVPILAFGGAVAALVVRGRRDPRLYRRLRARSLPRVTPQPPQRCLQGNS